jgi:hypothetical protein
MASARKSLFAWMTLGLMGLGACADAAPNDTQDGTFEVREYASEPAGDDLTASEGLAGETSNALENWEGEGELLAAEESCGLLCRLFGGDDANSDTSFGNESLASSGDNVFIRGPAPTKQSASRNGPYRVEKYTRGFARHAAFPGGTIHYPANAEAPWASVAVVPGFVSPESSIGTWGPFLASHGIVTFTIGTNSGLDQPPARARALLGALEVLRGENTRVGSPLYGKLDVSRQAVMGWSMGGGGALTAAEENPWLKAAISMCGWSPLGRFRSMRVPSLMFAGTADVLAGGQSGPFYDSIPNSTPKLLFEVSGAGHSFSNSPAFQNGEIGRYGLSWLKVFLEGDERYRQFLVQRPDSRMATFKHNL